MVQFHVLELIFVWSGHFTLSELLTTYTMESGKVVITPG